MHPNFVNVIIKSIAISILFFSIFLHDGVDKLVT